MCKVCTNKYGAMGIAKCRVVWYRATLCQANFWQIWLRIWKQKNLTMLHTLQSTLISPLCTPLQAHNLHGQAPRHLPPLSTLHTPHRPSEVLPFLPSLPICVVIFSSLNLVRPPLPFVPTAGARARTPLLFSALYRPIRLPKCSRRRSSAWHAHGRPALGTDGGRGGP
jgi:hypothetical protein